MAKEPVKQILNTAKITPDFCLGKNLVFNPTTLEETVLIQKRLLESGFRWPDGYSSFGALETCSTHGITLHNNHLYAGTVFTKMDNDYAQAAIERDGRVNPILVCTVDQFDDRYLPPDRAFLTQLFNGLTAQNAALAEKVAALSAELADVKKQLGPQTLDKPQLKGPNP